MPYRRILVPVDGSELTPRAIEASVALAQQLRATIVGFIAGPPAQAAAAGSPGLDEDERLTASQAQPVLARFGAAAQAAGVPFEGAIDPLPHVHRAIIAAAESHACDLIVMVTHGRGAFGEFLFGSQTKAVLAGSRLPLLILH
ncbi:MAG: universal stress protein [Rubrivivax sp.]|nr:universal stress protein [Rubrivivax sp.]